VGKLRKSVGVGIRHQEISECKPWLGLAKHNLDPWLVDASRRSCWQQRPAFQFRRTSHRFRSQMLIFLGFIAGYGWPLQHGDDWKFHRGILGDLRWWVVKRVGAANWRRKHMKTGKHMKTVRFYLRQTSCKVESSFSSCMIPFVLFFLRSTAVSTWDNQLLLMEVQPE